MLYNLNLLDSHIIIEYSEAAVNQVLDDAVIFQDLENNPLLPLPNPVPQIVHIFPEINQNNELVAPEILASETILERCGQWSLLPIILICFIIIVCTTC